MEITEAMIDRALEAMDAVRDATLKAGVVDGGEYRREMVRTCLASALSAQAEGGV